MSKLEAKSYSLQWIPVRNLAVVWSESQRPLQPAWVKEIADNFDTDLFDPIRVTLPNGNGIYHIVDGQNRKAAVESMWGPNEHVPCLVADEADPKRAAIIFRGINSGRKAISRIHDFNVAVTAESSVEVNINHIVRHNGYRVEGSHAADTIGAVDALKFAYSKGPRALDSTLRVLRDTWGGDPTAVTSALIKGYAILICEFHSDIDFNRLREVMAKRFTPGKLLINAKGAKENLNISIGAAVAHLVMQTYNRGCRKPLKRKASK